MAESSKPKATVGELAQSSKPRATVEEVFEDFKGRQSGLVRALTTDYLDFHHQCNPADERLLCLFGLPDGTWEVTTPSEMVPPDHPEPLLAINYMRDEVPKNDWLKSIAWHGDAWLFSLAFHLAYNLRFSEQDRTRLFEMMNDLPSVTETVQEFHIGKPKPFSPIQSEDTNKSGERKKRQQRPESAPAVQISEAAQCNEDDGGGEDDHTGTNEEDTPCASCGLVGHGDEFWIFCDICKRWLHGDCVNMTPATAALIEEYECPVCYGKRAKF